MMIVRSLLWAPLLAAAFSVHAGDVSKSDPALADRIALERVRWEARTWPEANGATKPRFDEGAIETALRRRVESGTAGRRGDGPRVGTADHARAGSSRDRPHGSLDA
jgi:hypothetical protein